MPRCICLCSYIKPQLVSGFTGSPHSCICLCSYIKPQLTYLYLWPIRVVYVSVPTSNHNRVKVAAQLLHVVYVSVPTSNHNCCINWLYNYVVVYVSVPTSNHNFVKGLPIPAVLYMSLFLHQTTTSIRIAI